MDEPAAGTDEVKSCGPYASCVDHRVFDSIQNGMGQKRSLWKTSEVAFSTLYQKTAAVALTGRLLLKPKL